MEIGNKNITSRRDIPLRGTQTISAEPDVDRSMVVERLENEIEYLKYELLQKITLIEKLTNDLHVNSVMSDDDINDSESLHWASSRLSSCNESHISDCNVENGCTGTEFLDVHQVGAEDIEYSRPEGDYENICKEVHQLRIDCSGLAKFMYDELSSIKRKIGLEVDEIPEEPSRDPTDRSSLNDDSADSYDFDWLQYSSGAAPRIFKKYGHKKGKGLGKNEDGRINPVSLVHQSTFSSNSSSHETVSTKKKEKRKKKIHILSDSILNQMDGERLAGSRELEVSVHSHGGCTVSCMYSHLVPVIKDNPDYVIIHIGTNDCEKKTSCEVLAEIMALKKYIEQATKAKVIFSLPTIRDDNKKANTIISNLITKWKKSGYMCLDNGNITVSHLGRKGLHLNKRGVKQIANNIINLIKRL